LVTLVRNRTVAMVDSIVARRCTQADHWS